MWNSSKHRESLLADPYSGSTSSNMYSHAASDDPSGIVNPNGDEHISSSSSSSASSDAKKKKDHTYGTFVGYCFTVNYILGVGVLGMPHAFVKGGWVLSTICLVLITIMAIFTASWLVDIQLRANFMRIANKKRNQHESSLEAEPLASGYASSSAEHGLSSMAAQGSSSSGGGGSSHASAPNTDSLFAHRYEVNELVELFFGRKIRKFYELCIIFYLVGSLWSYASVFASSMADHVALPSFNSGSSCDTTVDSSSSCTTLYRFYILLFSLIAIPLTCLDLTEMKGLQIFLAIFRFVSLGTMMVTSIVSMYSYANSDASAESSSSSPYYSQSIHAFSWGGLGLVFPTAIFAQIFHHSVPGLQHPLRSKRKAPFVFTSVLLTTCLIYTALGISVGLYYGNSISSPCTLNWANYTGHSSDYPYRKPIWAEIISYLVVLFPPVDIISAFPLNAITLANNIMCNFVSDSSKYNLLRIKLPFRLLAAIPPILGAVFVKDLSLILKWSGLTGIVIAFIFPALLQIRSRAVYSQFIQASAGVAVAASQTRLSATIASSSSSSSSSATTTATAAPSGRLGVAERYALEENDEDLGLIDFTRTHEITSIETLASHDLSNNEVEDELVLDYLQPTYNGKMINSPIATYVILAASFVGLLAVIILTALGLSD